MDKIFETQAKEILTLLDPEGRRKKREPRPFMVELFGTSNSGKTTLLDNIYVPFKVTGYEVAKSPEGAEAVPPRVWNRDLFDLHICLVTDVETALVRKYGPDHVKGAKYSTTTNPETSAQMLSVHQDLWRRLWKEDSKLLWHDTSAETPEETVGALLPLILDAFRKRFAIKA